MNPEIDIIRMEQSLSSCIVVPDKAIVWKNNGEYRATSWEKSFGAWGLDSNLYTLGESGFSVFCLAIYCGVDKDDLACYVIFDPDF